MKPHAPPSLCQSGDNWGHWPRHSLAHEFAKKNTTARLSTKATSGPLPFRSWFFSKSLRVFQMPKTKRCGERSFEFRLEMACERRLLGAFNQNRLEDGLKIRV
jgi:hypothetical protein